MSLNDITDKQQKIIKLLAKKGLKTYYNLYSRSGENIGSSSTVWAGLKALKDKGLIEPKDKPTEGKEHGKPKKPFGLTFKGLLYALNMDFILPSEAQETRILNEAKFPFSMHAKYLLERVSSYPKQWQESIENMLKKDLIDTPLILEKEFPEEIYTYLMRHINLQFYDDIDAANMWLTALASLGHRARQVLRTKGSVEILDETLSALLEGQLEEISVGALYRAIMDRAFKEFEQIERDIEAKLADHEARDEALQRLLKCKPEDVPKALDAMIKKFKFDVSRDELMKKLMDVESARLLKGRAAQLEPILRVKANTASL